MAAEPLEETIGVRMTRRSADAIRALASERNEKVGQTLRSLLETGLVMSQSIFVDTAGHVGGPDASESSTGVSAPVDAVGT